MTWEECRTVAGRLADSGIPVFPVAIKWDHAKEKTEKRPLTPHGHHDATTDPDTLAELFRRYIGLGPGEYPGVGAYPGPGGYVVIDVDNLDTLAELEVDHGQIPGRRVRTASGGLHVWQRLPEGVTIAQTSPWPGIDIRSSRGWVVAPWVRTPWGDWTPESGRIVEAPGWVVSALHTAETTKTAPLVESNGQKFGPGDRNDALFREARSMNRRGWTFERTVEALHIFNEAYCDPPHAADEVERAARSAFERYEQGRPPSIDLKLPGAPSEYRLVDPATVEPKAIEWLWKHRVATGTLTVLAGPGGVGKGALWVDLTAQATRGELDGDLHGQPVSALILTAEERVADVVGPRLRAANADLSRIRVMTMADGEFDRDATFPDDIPAVRSAIEDTGARLIVVDPLNAHLADRIDSHKDAPLRRALGPLTRLAGDVNAALLGVAHVNKGSGDAVNRVLGSVGYVNAARAVLIVGRPPDAEDGSPARVVALPKTNNSPEVSALRFELEGRMIPGIQADGTRGEIEVVGVTWKGEDSASAEDLLGTAEDRSALGEAVEWLRRELAAGPREKRELFKDAHAEGIADRTLHRARRHLKVDVYRDETRQGRPSTWILPGYVPGLDDTKPLARNLQASDQGKQSDSGGYVPSTGDGTKPPPARSYVTGEELPEVDW